MSRGPQFSRIAALFSTALRKATLFALSLAAVLAAVLVCALHVTADQALVIVGHLQGSDASVETATAGSDTISSAEAGVDVANGSIVTIHSGQAHMTLKSGGSVDICGPAKLTLLQSGTAITLALNFGRVRVQLPASTDLKIFTPTIVATPLDINGTARDITAGLDLDDSLCVNASSGALLLENQFSGEKLVVPQGGEFSLAQGKLVPVAGAPGTCQCETLETKEIIPPPEPSLGLTAPPHVDPPTPTPPAAANPAAPADTKSKSSVEYSVLGYANQVHPSAPAPKAAPAAPPATEMPDYKIVMPALTFSASSPAPPPDPTPDMVLLIRTVHVEPDWEFTGRVDAPPMPDQAKPAKSNSESAKQPAPADSQSPPHAKKEGFWSKFKRIFSGNSSS